MNKAEASELKEKILKGVSLAFERLVEQKKKNDESLILLQDGKVVRIKAKDIK
jgi:hypothetical protein